jgi:hypothetical protein
MASDSALPDGETASVRYFRPVDPAEAAEFDSFLQLLPQLRSCYAGCYVAVRGGQVIASGAYADAVHKQATGSGAAPFYCAWVEPPEGHIFRVGAPRLIAEARSE